MDIKLGDKPYTEGQQIGLKDNISFTISYVLKEGTLSKEQDTIIYKLPDNFDLSDVQDPSTLKGSVFSDNGTKIGTYTIDKDTGWIVIQFTHEGTIKGNQSGEVEGFITFKCTGSEATKGDGKSTAIQWNDKVSTPIHVEEASAKTDDLQVTKTASKPSEGSNTVLFTVTVSSQNGTSEAVSLKDVMHADQNLNLAYTTSPTPLTIRDEKNDRINPDPIPAEGQTSFDLSLPQMQANSTYTIQYYAKLNKDNVSATGHNDVTVSSRNQDGKLLKDEANVDVSFKQNLIKKTGEKLGDGRIRWTVTINPNGEDLGGWTLQDELNGHSLGQNITLKTKDSSQETKTVSLPYTFKQNDHNTYTVTYVTDERVVGNSSVTNKATLTKDNEPTRTDEQTVHFDDTQSKGKFEKKGTGITVAADQKTAILSWSVNINPEGSSIPAPWRFSDHFGDGNQTQSFTDEQKQEVENAWKMQFPQKDAFSIEWKENGYDITVNQPLTTSFGYTYHTNGTIENPQESQTFTNNANVFTNNWQWLFGDSGTNEYQPKYPLIEKLDGIQNVSSDTKYDSQDERIMDRNHRNQLRLKWRIIVNIPQNKKAAVGNLTITDQIPEGMKFDQLENAEYGWYIQNSGTISFWSQKAQRSYDLTANISDQSVILTLPQAFLQSLGENQILDFNIYATVNEDSTWKIGDVKRETNTVTISDANHQLTDNNTASQTQIITRKAKPEERLVQKSITNYNHGGQYEGNVIDYSVIVNPERKDLDPGSDTIQACDDLKYTWGNYSNFDVSLVPESLKVYEVHENGTETLLKAGVDYRYTLSATQRPAANSYDEPDIDNCINFTLPDSQKLKIEYSYKYSGIANSWTDVSNVFNILGHSTGDNGGDANTPTQITQSAAGANAKTISMYKVDQSDYGRTLSGAKFQLERYNASNGLYETVASNIQSSTDGSVLLGKSLAFNTAYRLVEILSPNGYLKNGVPFDFMMVNQNLNKYPRQAPADFSGTEFNGGDIYYFENFKDNAPHYVLPDTGGRGTFLYEAGGIVMLTAGVLLLGTTWFRTRKRI